MWFNAYIFGQRINRAVSCVSRFARVQKSAINLDPEPRDNLSFLCEAVENYKPLCISRCLSKTCLVFTDGAYEPSSNHPATVGGVLIHPCGSIVACFGEALCEALTNQFVAESRHPIYKLELFPVLISLVLWG